MWRNSSVRVLTNELRHDIDSNVAQLLKLLQEEADIFEETCGTLGIKIRPSQKGVNTLIELLALVSKSPLIPIRWIYDDNISSLRDEAYRYQQDTTAILDSKSNLLDIYKDDILDLDGENIHATIEQCMTTFCALLDAESKNAIATKIKDKLATINASLECLSEMFEQGRILSEELGGDAPSSYDKLQDPILYKHQRMQEHHFESRVRNSYHRSLYIESNRYYHSLSDIYLQCLYQNYLSLQDDYKYAHRLDMQKDGWDILRTYTYACRKTRCSIHACIQVGNLISS